VDLDDKMPTYDYTFKVLVLGDSSIEKTSFTKRYCYNIFNPSERLTIGVDFHVKTIELHGKIIKLQIWDVGGEERFRFLLPTYCLGANAAIILYNITRPQTLDNINEWASIVRQKGGPIPITLVGGNIDLAETQRKVPREYGIQIAERNNIACFGEISSKTGQNVNRTFEVLVELMLENMGERVSPYFIEIPIRVEQEELKKFYFPAIEDILLFMYRRAGRYKWQTTFNFLKGKILNFRDEEVKEGFNWLKKRSNYIDNVSSASIKVNEKGIQFLKSLGKIVK